tara:strand:- start:7536 stop:8804 length:1269 start_codon:yes stop_codon:yes gene_type:complete
MNNNVLVLGSGGREHAMVWKLSKESKVKNIFCIPGNAGTSQIATNKSLSLTDYDKLLEFVNKNNINLIIVGPENLLDDGIVDFFNSNNKKIFGPSKAASSLESSKIYARDIMKKYNIPHPKYFSCITRNDVQKAKEFLGFPIVLKADGLAAGKGVIICNNENEYNKALDVFFENQSFGTASDKISVEECIQGPEISIFVSCNGSQYKILNNAQDHKRAFNQDKGPNTGGMGAYAPTPLYNSKLESKIKSKIIEPTLNAMISEGHPYCGFLYFGLMLVKGDPYVIEYNVRMGDPETQVVMPMMDCSLYDLLNATLEKKLDTFNYKNKSGFCVTVVLAANGYPLKYETGNIINGLDKLKNDLVFHAGTALNDKKFIVSGGRVLNTIGYGSDLKTAINKAYKVINNVDFKNMFFRTDIGKKGLDY